jgi:hypothetical protein
MCEIKVNTAQPNNQKQQHWIRVSDECQNDDGKHSGGVEKQ